MQKILYALPRYRFSGIRQTEDVLISEVKRIMGEPFVKVFYWGSFTNRDGLIFRLFSRLADLIHFVWLCVRYRPYIAHLNTSFDRKAVMRDLFFSGAARLLGVKVLLKIHGSDSDFIKDKNFLWRRLADIDLKCATAICFGTFTEINEIVSNFNIEKKVCHAVRNAIDMSEFDKMESDKTYITGLDESSPSVLYLSRINREKGAFDFLESIPFVVAKKKAKFYFGGFGEDREVICDLIKDRNLQDHVHVLPILTDETVKRIYHFYDIMVFPTHCAEGIPLSLLNAMACGTPIITTKFRFSIDYLSQPDNCLFVECDNPRQLADSIVYLLDHPEIREAMSENNRKLCDRFDKEIVAGEYLKLYQSL